MTYTAPDLSEILSNEQELNSRLINCRTTLQGILNKNNISYQASEGIIPLIRKLPYPIPTTIEWNNYVNWLTLSGPQTSNKSASCYPVVRDQSGRAISNVPITIRRKAISGGNWINYGNYTSGNTINLTADSNRGGYIYECYPTANPSISSQIALPQYYFNYDEDEYGGYKYFEILDTSNPLISRNVKSIDIWDLYDGYNHFDIIAQDNGEMLVAIPLKNTPPILGADINTNIYIGYDVTRGDIPSSNVVNGVGGGMVGNGSRNSIGIFLDASDKDFTSTYGTSFNSTISNHGYTEAGVSKECFVRIPGGNSGQYTYFENNDNISHYGPYWYGNMLGSNYAPCVVVYNSNMNAGQRLRVKIKYIKAVTP